MCHEEERGECLQHGRCAQSRSADARAVFDSLHRPLRRSLCLALLLLPRGAASLSCWCWCWCWCCSQSMRRRPSLASRQALARAIHTRLPPATSPPLYPSNAIRTAKYTFYTFLPRNLFEQFSKVANLYFLVIIVIQCFPSIRTTHPIFAALPVLLIVGVTAFKDALEDRKRTLSDLTLNHSLTHTLPDCAPFYRNVNYPSSPSTSASTTTTSTSTTSTTTTTISPTPPAHQHTLSWQPTLWQHVRVGDFVLLRNNDPVPADLLLLSASEKDNSCYIETKNLDGETNLKLRYGLPQLAHVHLPTHCAHLALHIDSEAPNPNLYSYRGTITINTSSLPPCPPPSSPLSPYSSNEKEYPTSQQDQDVLVPLGPDNLLLRGCMVRNTDWLIGLVLYTGTDTKIILNSGNTPSKRSRIDRQMNPHILMNFAILIVMCLICAILGTFVTDNYNMHGFTDPNLFHRLRPSGWTNSILTFFSCLVVFQNIVPISLYISVEAVKTMQACLVAHPLT